MQLIMGVKGMIMYSYFDLFSGPEGRKEFDRRWPEVCRVAKLVSELGDYVLGVRTDAVSHGSRLPEQ